MKLLTLLLGLSLVFSLPAVSYADDWNSDTEMEDSSDTSNESYGSLDDESPVIDEPAAEVPQPQEKKPVKKIKKLVKKSTSKKIKKKEKDI